MKFLDSVKKFYREQMCGSPDWVAAWDQAAPERRDQLAQTIAESHRRSDESAVRVRTTIWNRDQAELAEAARIEKRNEEIAANLRRIADNSDSLPRIEGHTKATSENTAEIRDDVKSIRWMLEAEEYG